MSAALKKNNDVKESSEPISLPNADDKIAEMAYYKAESRGFEPGYELDDWLASEKEFMECRGG